MIKIFLSYRRDDSRAIAGRIFDRLEAKFGRDCVFMDVDTIPLGTDFRKHLQQAVSQCNIFLAVIGEHWLSSCDAKGARRLDSPKDFVRIEVETALTRGIPVIPVLVGHDDMPSPEELHGTLQELAFRHALVVDMGTDFHHHIDRLIRGIERLVPPPGDQGDVSPPRASNSQNRLIPPPAPEASASETSLDSKQAKIDLPPDVLAQMLEKSISNIQENNRQGREAATRVLFGQPAPSIPPAPLPDLATQMANAKSQAEQLHAQAQAALSKYDYAAAVNLLEQIPVKLRNQQRYIEAVTKRDRLAELEATISQLVSEHEHRELIAPVQQALELFPGRADLVALQSQLPLDIRWPGHIAGDQAIIEILNLQIPFRWCPAGKYTMGSPRDETGRRDNENQVQIELTQGFWLGETVVTQELYAAVMNTNPSHFKGPQRPVEQVSWNEAQAFCTAFTKLLRNEGLLAANSNIRLPTEAEWEYACRAGTTTAYSFGNDAAQLGQYAWFEGNSGKETKPVGTHKANPLGLYDMHGNVWEWCQDGSEEKLRGGEDPVVGSRSSRVVRGGSWVNVAFFVRSSFRDYYTPNLRSYCIGFRVVAE